MTKTTILAGAAAVLAIAAPASLAAPLQPRERSNVKGQNTVSVSELPNGNHVTNGGQTAVGTATDSGNIVDAMESAARRCVARTSAEFQRMCAAATGGLEDMGFTPAQTRAILQGARTITNLTGGRISGADALNASRGLVASGMRYQAQSSAARSRQTGHRERLARTGSQNPSGKITLHSAEVLKTPEVTNGGFAGGGRFTISGAITDKGHVTDYRTVKGNTALLRRVAVGEKGTITFLITIDLATGAEPWTITSGTGSYKGLHGHGTEVADEWWNTPAHFTMLGTVSG